METVLISDSCPVRSHFIRQIDGKYPVNGIATSSWVARKRQARDGYGKVQWTDEVIQ